MRTRVIPAIVARLAATVLASWVGVGWPVGARAGSADSLSSRMESAGLVDVRGIDPSLRVDLKYASEENLMGGNVYGSLDRCYLQPEVAQMLARASRLLKERRAELRLLLADCARPRSVQVRMWEVVRNTSQRRYVANPGRGSMHNFGTAVDVTLAFADGTPLDMGTAIDHLGPLAHSSAEDRHLREGKLTREQVDNRRLLRAVMVEAGFRPIAIEWWHFEAFERESTRRRFAIIE